MEGRGRGEQSERTKGRTTVEGRCKPEGGDLQRLREGRKSGSRRASTLPWTAGKKRGGGRAQARKRVEGGGGRKGGSPSRPDHGPSLVGTPAGDGRCYGCKHRVSEAKSGKRKERRDSLRLHVHPSPLRFRELGCCLGDVLGKVLVPLGDVGTADEEVRGVCAANEGSDDLGGRGVEAGPGRTVEIREVCRDRDVMKPRVKPLGVPLREDGHLRRKRSETKKRVE